MNIFIVEEMYGTGEIRLKDDKDLSLTKPINSCLQMTKPDGSKVVQFFCTRNLGFPVLLARVPFQEGCSNSSDICKFVF